MGSLRAILPRSSHLGPQFDDLEGTLVSVADKLFNSRNRTSPVKDLVLEIESLAAERGLNLYRWESSHSRFGKTITYKVLKGDRPAYSGQAVSDYPEVVLTKAEGVGLDCQAYRELLLLRNSLAK